MELHTTIGPAHTTDVAIAGRAGVTRRTFYRHFPDDVSLFRACTAHTMAMWPLPETAAWRALKDPARRLDLALRDLYAYYRKAGAGLAVVLRDAPFLRPGLVPPTGRAERMRAIDQALLEGWGARGRRLAMLRAAIAHATSVMTWRSLVAEQGLADDEAVALLEAMVLSV